MFKDTKHISYLVIRKKGFPILDKSKIQVDDYVALPKIEKGYALEHSVCHINGKYVEDMAAIIKLENVAVRKNVVQAWKYNKKENKLEKVPPNHVTCDNDGWGA